MLAWISREKNKHKKTTREGESCFARVLNCRGGAYDKGVYICESNDMDERNNLVKPEIFRISAAQAAGLPDTLLEHVSVEMRSLRTNGNGACGIHGIFGEPAPALTGGVELFASSARALASQHLGPCLENLEQLAGFQEQVRAIKDHFWDGFVIAQLQGPRTAESCAAAFVLWSTRQHFFFSHGLGTNSKGYEQISG